MAIVNNESGEELIKFDANATKKGFFEGISPKVPDLLDKMRKSGIIPTERDWHFKKCGKEVRV